MTARELAAKVGNELGFGSMFSPYAGTPEAYQALSLDEQIRLTNAMKAYIRAHPEEFTAVQNQVAAGGDIPAADFYTWAEKLSDFGGAAAAQADALNPLSAQNRGKTAAFLLVVAFVAVAVYVLPAGIALARKAAPPAP